jgi:RNA polymerase II subunit A C-terminal domain phosphatase SSU72
MLSFYKYFFSERVYDQVLEDFNHREQSLFTQCHVINCDITDNHEDATIGAIILSQLMEEIAHHADIDNDIDEVLQAFEGEKNRPLMHAVMFY